MVKPAAALSCASYGSWSNSHQYVAQKGGWCMHNDLGGEQLIWQGDGNLVMYETSLNASNALWASNTAGRGQILKFQSDGNIVVYDASNNAIWAASSHGDQLQSPNVANNYYLRFPSAASRIVETANSRQIWSY